MAKIESFEDLIIWQNAKQLFIELHKEFRSFNEYYLRDQILRAALSISNNIAEGFERRSQK
ncbi:MAG: four helix bundle protein, partial [Bacteroidetes bacterium]|nr:four helix bundle protein [Bacteroidota bacterium]